MPTISEAIRLASQDLIRAGVQEEEAHLEARLLYQHAVGLTVAELIAALSQTASVSALETLRRLVVERSQRKPLAYIVGEREFFGRSFHVDHRALVPRPESEMLVEIALSFIRSREIEGPRICDIGTGSGILAITLALEIPESRITATDVSPTALDLAQSNTHRLGVQSDQITFMREDATLSPTSYASTRFDVVVSNPPYIRSQSLELLEPEVRDWEPRLALDGGPDGMKVTRPLIASLPHMLSLETPSAAFIEIDPPVADQSLAIARKSFPYANISITNDLTGHARVLSILA